MKKKSASRTKGKSSKTKNYSGPKLLEKLITPKNIVIALLFICVLTLAYSTVMLAELNRRNINDTNERFEASFKGSQAALGFACGAFTETDAEQFLGGEVVRWSLFVGLDTFGLKMPAGRELGIREGCYYSLKSNDASYANVMLQTYSSPEAAAIAFEHDIVDSLPNVVEESHERGRLVISDNDYNLLSGNRIMVVLAEKGSAETHLRDSKELFDRVVPKLPSQ